ncbi:phosphate signaling complex protein PhoU [Mycolicibacterium rhodesiae]|uniref:Phosphate-specific transport system accessory protein PhoU n=1 Tax=Mycolicibacterium rhodesiae TaxID=36814 RepID=A0A1X0J615_MYCRH|nr:phosphate signaling complex protein PhoU [Mycolicibacterium rhodesiae]MCV7345526.1 phosphate signaling complex protein PhoU [Mycolicibacterium rhodesiae]ORB57548.1 phosphate transport system regulatory protein PhoU [Mycolicibacterium rhodesiae]
MRTVFHENLDELNGQLAKMCGRAGVAMKSATHALLAADLSAAEQVITAHDQMVGMRSDAEQAAFALLALQQPVAGDLRAVFSAIQIIADTERMDALAVHVAKIARLRYPEHTVYGEVSDCFAEMGRLAVGLGESAQQVLLTGDPAEAAHLREQDTSMDDLYRRLFSLLMSPSWDHGIAAAVDTALLGRFYERFADHAVEIGRRVVFIATGALPPEDDISTY